VRLGFAVAAHLQTEVLLIDEVLAVGDASFQRRCVETLDALHKAGRTMILVSHDLNAVRALCARAILFDHGEIRMQGRTGDVIRAIIDAQVAAGSPDASSAGNGADGRPTRLYLSRREITESMQACLIGGWYEPEDTHCWTMRRAQAHLHIPSQASQLCLEVASMRPPDGGRPLPLKISIDDGQPETIYLTQPSWQIVRVRLPPWAHGRSIQVALEAERTMVPNLLYLNGDSRELGIAVSRVWSE